MMALERRLAVLGAGTMGHGIAQVAAMAGHRVVLVDTSQSLALRGVERIRENLAAGIERGKVTPDDREATLARVTASADLPTAAAAADVIIEAVPERLDLKLAVLTTAESGARPDAMLATNTSSLSVTEMQQCLAHPQRMLGLHFFNPVHLNRLVEVVRGDHTSDDTLATGLALVQEIGKEAVVVRDSPGFATSRLGVLLGLEAMRMVESGVAAAEDIDKAMELGYRHPMGPLRLSDLIGLDVRLDIARYLYEKLGSEQFRPPRILEDMVAQGKLGKKTGTGFYSWTEA